MRGELETMEDDDPLRTGMLWIATTHFVTAVIKSGVLALPWSVAQMGGITGPIVLVAGSDVTCYTAILLTDCCRTPDPVKGRRNCTYMDVVRSSLDPKNVLFCGLVQFVMLRGTIIGYTITAATSMMAVVCSNCYHYKGHDARCSASGTLYMIIFGTVEVILSQFSSLEKIIVISVVTAVMSFAYSLIGLLMCIAKFASHHAIRGTVLGVEVGADGVSTLTKTWHALQALGNIVFAYTYAMLLIEIRDTLKSPPLENQLSGWRVELLREKRLR